MPSILWHSRTTEPIDSLHHVVIAINGARYEYDLLSLAADNAEYLFKHVSAGKGLVYVKRHQRGWRKL